MEGVILRLLPRARTFLPLELSMHEKTSYTSVSDYLYDPDHVVFNDIEYTVAIAGLSEASPNSVQVWLNDDLLSCFIQKSGDILQVQFSSDYQKLFFESFGFARFTIELEISGELYYLESNYVQVMVRKSALNDSVRRMADYVNHTNPGLLYGSDYTPGQDDDNQDNRKTIEAKLKLLHRISAVYEENYRFFKANSRFATIPVERVDDFEKLQFITNSTLQYISRHQEHLVRVPGSGGIRIGSSYYQPAKTMVQASEKSYDIYENRVLIAFLVRLCRDLSDLVSELEALINKVPGRPIERDGYISSSYFIYQNVADNLRAYYDEFRALRSKFRSLLLSYRKELKVCDIILNSVPRFTPVFQAVPQYHQVFDCIVAWFTNTGYSLIQEKYILSVVKVSALYELYVLAKMLNYYKNSGFDFISATRLNYSFSAQSLYENTECNNLFIFRKGSLKVSVYYQPVIYHEDRRDMGRLGLYRNTSIGFSRAEDEPGRTGKYYTPDYVIKYEYDNIDGADYLICDAKFRRVETIKQTQISSLTFKYLFSVSPFNLNDRIVELLVFSGVSDYTEDGVIDIYDFSKNPRQGIPQAEIMTLTENSSDNISLHNFLLRETIGRVKPDRTLSSTKIPAPSNHAPAYNLSNRSDNRQERELSYAAAEKKTKFTEKSNQEEPPSLQQDNQKRKKIGKKDPMELLLDTLVLPQQLLSYFNSLGLKTIGDVVPNKSRADLLALDQLNRQNRRQLEAVFKEKKVVLH